MDPFTAAMLAGTALQMYGNYKANMDEAAAEAANASWMREQQAMIQKSTNRELLNYNKDANDVMAAMENTFAKSGISMEGSAQVLRQQNELIKMQEINSIVDMGNMQMREASLKIGASQNKQSQLTSGFNNAVQGFAIGASGAVNARKVYKDEKAYAASKG